MNKDISCYGCGALIQSEEVKKIGYVPKAALDKETVLCQRCFRLNHYHDLQETTLTKDDFLNILQTIGEQNALIVYIIDIFDFNGSLIPGIQRHLLDNDIFVVANKRDVLPKSLKDKKITDWIRSQFKEYGLKPLDILLASAKKSYHLDTLMEKIELYRKNRDVYIVGVTNVGKSTLINSLLKHYSKQNEHFITTSEFPGTTLNLIEIPLDDDTSLYDSPGIINEHQMAHYIKTSDLSLITPKGELKPKTYQLNSQQTLYFGGLARMDFISGEKTNFSCFFPLYLDIHRTKLENACQLYNRGKTLSPVIETITNIDEMTTHSFKIDDKKIDIVISGLGWISLKGNNQVIKIKAPKGVGVFLRRALV